MALVIRDDLEREDIVGSLDEEWLGREAAGGGRRADRWYRRQVRGLVTRYVLRRLGGGTALLGDLVQDARLAIRGLARRPGYSVGTALTLGVGIGMATTIGSFVHSMLVRPLPFPEPERVVSVWPERWYSPAFFDLVVQQTSSFEALAAWHWRAHLEVGPDGTERLFGPLVSARYFDVLGSQTALGRTFAEGEDTPGRDGVAVLSHGYWQRRFGGDPSVLGRTLDLRGTPRTIVGVAPAGFEFLRPGTDVVIPIVRDPGSVRYRDSSYKVIGRLRPDVAVQQATAELQGLVRRIREANDLPPDWGSDARVVPLAEALMGDTGPTLLLLLGAVVVLLAITVANVAHLVLVRALGRRREVALRSALGAGRGRLARELWTESTLLGLAGSVPGGALALITVPAVAGLFPPETPRLDSVEVGAPVFFAAVGIGLVSGLLMGLVPILRSIGDPRDALHRGSDGPGRGASRAARALVMSEVALAVALVATSGVLAKSLARLYALDPGFRTDGVLSFEVVAPPGRIETFEESLTYFRRIEAAVEALPGVVSASGTTRAPMAPDGNVVSISAEARPPSSRDEQVLTRWLQATPDLFATAGIELIAGRYLTEEDGPGAEPVAVVTERVARVVLAGEDPIGKRIVTGFEAEPVRVVGVVADQRLLSLDREPPLIVYRPYAQTAAVSQRFGVSSDRAFLVRVATEPSAFAPQIRTAIRSVDPTALVEGIRSVDEAVAGSVVTRRVILTLLGLFASTAVVLGCVGVFAVLAHAVQARRREIGLRLALGATSRSVLEDVVTSGIRLWAVGTGAGLVLVLAMTRVVANFTYGVPAADPMVLAVTALFVLLVIVTASLVPARRAVRTDPATVLADVSG